MVPCLSHFPDLCLETIFSHVPLVDLLRSVGLVCTSWYRSRRTELNRRRRLVIVQRRTLLTGLSSNVIYCTHGTNLIEHVRRDDGLPWLTLQSPEQIEFDLVVVPNGVPIAPLISSLAANLWHITHLTLVFASATSPVLLQLIHLLDHLSEHLINLKLNIWTITDYHSEPALNPNPLFDCLNRLRSLRHLRLFLRFPDYLALRPQLLFLSRLSTLAIRIGGVQLEWLLSSLAQYGTNIDSIDLFDSLGLNRFNHLDQRLLQGNFNFNAFSLFMTGATEQFYDEMKRFCTRFSTLTKLKLIGCSRMPMTMLARCLSQLGQLVYLNLQCGSIAQLEAAQQNDDEEGGQVEPAIAQVPSVRLLSLRFNTTSHLDTARLCISQIFPNLQVLRLEHRIVQCPHCAITLKADGYGPFDNAEAELADRLIECHRLTREPFRGCTKLHTVSLVVDFGREMLININQL